MLLPLGPREPNAKQSSILHRFDISSLPVKACAMRLSWNEIRARAARFAEEWAGAKYEKGEAQSFYNDFFDVFGVKRRKVASFEEPVKKLGDKRGQGRSERHRQNQAANAFKRPWEARWPPAA